MNFFILMLATGTTLLEGWVTRLGSWIQWLFVPYFLLWTVMTGGAMISGCGVAGAGLIPLGDPDTSRIIWGIVHSLVGLALVWVGGFRVFEKIMAVCIGVMFVGVLITAVLLRPDWSAVFSGVFVPTVPAGGSPWVLGILGGVGGTVTLLAYGYWIRETGREGKSGVRICRLDLGVAYTLTALFGMAMVIIGSRITVEGQGAQMAVQLADQLGLVLGPFGKWMFLLGAAAASTNYGLGRVKVSSKARFKRGALGPGSLQVERDVIVRVDSQDVRVDLTRPRLDVAAGCRCPV